MLIILMLEMLMLLILMLAMRLIYAIKRGYNLLANFINAIKR